jgi:predicted permease
MTAPRVSRAVVSLLRAVLSLYPARFRRRFESEILQSARRDLEQATESGPSALAAVSARELSQALAGVIPQHRLERAVTRRPGMAGRIGQALSSTTADVRLALRSLAHARMFTLVSLLVLALGIGASAAIFSVVDAVVLRGLPFPGHDRLAVVLEYQPGRDTRGQVTTMQTFLDWRREQRSFVSLSAVSNIRFRMIDENGRPAIVQGQRITREFFDTLGVAPLLGRGFTADEETDSGRRVVALGHAFWRRAFGGSREAIGRTIELGGETWEVVAVMPPDFTYPVAAGRPTDVYGPARVSATDRTRERVGRNYSWIAIGRLAPGVSTAQAQDDMHRITAALDAEYPRWFNGARAQVVSLHHHLVGEVRSWMLLLLASVVLVLAIACANVANLMLARSTVRERELGIRSALGAGRWRLTRMLVVEGLVLSAGGAALGLLVAAAALSAITASLPAALPRAAGIGIDLRVIAAASAAALVTGVLFGLLPALQSSRPDVALALRDGGRALTSGRGSRVRSALVVAEVALAVMLVVGAGLFTGSFVQLLRVDAGFDYRNLLTFDIGVRIDPRALEAATLEGREARAAFIARERSRNGPYLRAVIGAVRRVPGVVNAGAVNGGVPLTGSYMRMDVTLPGGVALGGDEDDVDVREVTPGYLETLGLPLHAGRRITDDDRVSGASVVVINEAAAKKYWPGANALGQQMSLERKTMRTVIGIVGDLRHLGPEATKRQEVYVPIGDDVGAGLLIRTAGDPMAAAPLVKAAIWSVNKDQYLPDDDIVVERYLDQMIAERRFTMALLALLGTLALVIAAAGVYGVMAYVVSQRTQEIGVRMALGAKPADVVGMVMGRAGVLVACGLAIGTAAAWYLSAAVQAFLFLIAPTDWRVFAAAAAALGLSAMAACAVPATRASRVDPLIALRGD